MGDQRLNRPFSVTFSTKEFRGERLANLEILTAVTLKPDKVKKEDIKGIQILVSQCVITLTNLEAKECIKIEGFSFRGRHIQVTDADLNVTNVTLKDAPLEMNDACLMGVLYPYGEVIGGTIRHGTIRGTKIETGTRYLQMAGVDNPIPEVLYAGRFGIRVFCDNNKTVCSHCKSPEHLSYKCPNKPPHQPKACFKCGDTDHLAAECPTSEPFCTHCGRSGHYLRNCPERSANLRLEENGKIIYKGKSYNGIRAFRGSNDVFSNLYHVKEGVMYDKKSHNSIEHAYKSQKAIYFHKEELTETVDTTYSAYKAMNLVDKALEGQDCEEWVANRQGIMKTCVIAEAKSCKEFHDSLLNSITVRA